MNRFFVTNAASPRPATVSTNDLRTASPVFGNTFFSDSTCGVGVTGSSDFGVSGVLGSSSLGNSMCNSGKSSTGASLGTVPMAIQVCLALVHHLVQCQW